MVVFIVKKGIIAGNYPWQERKDTIFRVEKSDPEGKPHMCWWSLQL